MNISGSFGEIDKVGISQPCQSSVDSIKEVVSRDVVGGLYPLSLEQSPKSLGNVQMWGIRRQYQEEELKRIRRESMPRAVTPTPTSHKAKETVSVNQPNLFDF